MKSLKIYLVLIITLGMAGCTDKILEVFTANSPVYMDYEQLRHAVQKRSAREIVNPGKIYFKDNFIFIVEEMNGIHIINNQNPANPVNISFIEVPGNVDIAIKGDVLYADSFIDLVAIDISNMETIHEISRVVDVLPYTIPSYDENYPLARIDREKGVVIEWEIKEVRQEVENYYYPVYRDVEGGWSNDGAQGGVSGGVSSNGAGIGGSMARFGIAENTLFAVDQNTMHIFSLSDPENPEHKKDFNAGWNIETLFIVDNNMFLGSQNGMRIYDISVPNSPMYLSDFWHMTGCDPVVVKGDIAYITLRGGNNCGNNLNLLVVVSIKNIREPVELKSYPMESPYGLGIDGDLLFICDGDAGLKVYDASDPLKISDNRVAAFPDINGFDVIPFAGILMMIGEDGLYQYDYNNIDNIVFLSKIQVGQ